MNKILQKVLSIFLCILLLSAYIPFGIVPTVNAASDIASTTYNINLSPQPPTDIICKYKSDTEAELSWKAPGETSIAGYDIYCEGKNEPMASTTETRCTINSLKPSTTYTFTIKTKYANGFLSDDSKPVVVLTDKDIKAPSSPSTLSLYSRHDTAVTIKWTPSQDNDSVSGYEIYRNGMKIATRNSPAYTDTGLVAGTLYRYAVKAYDPAGNVSSISSTLYVTTRLADDNGDSFTDANPIDVGVQESAKINHGGDVDFFYFNTVWTGTYSIQSTGSTDTYAELYDSEGNLIANNNDLSQSDKNFYMKVNLTQYSKYYIKVRTNNTTDTGNYGLLVKLISKVQTSSTSTVTASMGQKLSDLNAVAVNGKIYVMGGHNYLEGGSSEKIRMYDSSTDTWTTKTEVMPAPVWSYGMTAIGSKIYVAGGAGKGITNRVYEYDTIAGTWQQKISMSKARMGHGLAEIEGKLYVFGGAGYGKGLETAEYEGTVEVFDTSNETAGWQVKKSMPTPRADFAWAALEKKIYIFGGHNKDGNQLDTVDVYDTINNSWNTLETKMPVPRTGCKAVVRNGKINIIGGLGAGNSFLPNIDVFDPVSGSWSKDMNLNVPRKGMAAVEYNGSIYVMGGYNSNGCTNAMETIDLFKFKIKTTSSNQSYNFPISSISGTTDIVVNWGDGTTSTISAYSGRTHKYAAAGTYTIKVISFVKMPISFYGDTKLTEVLTPIPNIGATSFYNCFSGCSELTAIPSNLFINGVNVTDFSSCFYNCSSLVNIPSDLFKYNVNATNLYGCFSYCMKLAAVPEGLFDKNPCVTDLRFCFYCCYNLSEIPRGLFDRNVNVTDFSNCFDNCRNLNAIPAGLFDKNINVTTFYECFKKCSSLTEIPEGLFDNNVKVTDFRSCFDGCSSLAAIPAGLFDNNINATNYEYCFNGCSSLKEIPTGLFDNCVKADDFYYCFGNCSKLIAIPSGLFNKNINITDIECCFYNCSSLTMIPAGLFDKNVKVTSFYNCFYGCRSLVTIPAGLFDKNVIVTKFSYCFYNCSSLTSIPAGLFDNNVNVTDFGSSFQGCSSLTAIPAGLFDNNVKITTFAFCFYGCSKLSEIPAGLFDKNVNVTNFSSSFSDCTSLAAIPSGLFDNNVKVTHFSNCFQLCSNLKSIPSGLFDKNVNVTYFSYCFYKCSNLTGVAPALWLRSPVPSGSSCFYKCELLSNYSSIPSSWK